MRNPAIANSAWPVLAWIALNLADACITLIGIEHGLLEANAILGNFLGPELVVIKFILAIAVLWGLHRFRKLHLLLPLNIGMGVIAIWNLAAILLNG
ncbi:hypothetical protein LCGC14_2490870 [marine sediment metagenome]|uniref:Uncharacterized protein n=1 Tax=marine sediment metagenome TaxID=412755 RepID=A0A0F9BSN4_9ZZZZ